MNRHLSTRARDAAVAEAAERHRVGVREILSDTRNHTIAHARQEVMWLLRRQGYSSPQIGSALSRDHATVLFGIARHASRIQPDTHVDEPEAMVPPAVTHPGMNYEPGEDALLDHCIETDS